MSQKEEKDKKKKIVFNEADTKLLKDLIKEKTSVVNGKETSSGEIIRKEVWETITDSFNSSATGGSKTIEQLRVKFKNMKSAEKKILPQNAKEIRKTGDQLRVADLIDVDNIFDYSLEVQVPGLLNEVDSDAPTNLLSVSDNNQLDTKKSLKRKLYEDNNDLYELKRRNLELKHSLLEIQVKKFDLIYKKKIEKLNLEIDELNESRRRNLELRNNLLELKAQNFDLIYNKKIEKLNLEIELLKNKRDYKLELDSDISD